MNRFLISLGVRIAGADACSSHEPRRGFLLNALLAACLAFSFGFLFPNQAVAETVLQTDVYIAVPPVEGESVSQLYYGPRDSVALPNSAFGSNGIAAYDAKYHGAKAIKKRIEETFGWTNKQYKTCGIKFEIRNIYFIRADHDKLKKNYNKEDEQLGFGTDKKTKKSSLLAGFKDAAVASDSFNVLFAPLTVEGEPGRAEQPGNTSVVDLSTAFNKLNQGQILIHEFGHNLGLGDRQYSDSEWIKRLKNAMSDSLPNRAQPGKPDYNKKSDPKLTKKECDEIKSRVSKGLYDKYKKPVKTSLLTPSDGTDDQQTAMAVPVSYDGVSNGHAPSPVGPSWLFGTPVYVGNLDRASTGMFGTEDNALNVINPGNLLFLTNDELFVLYGLDLIHRWVFGESVWDIRFGFGYGMSDGDQVIDRVSPGDGNDLLIFGPQGPTGLTGGGLNAGPRDAVNINHINDNEFHEFRFGFGPFIPLGPRWGARVGPTVSYGHWDLTERLWGSVEGVNQTFMYHNMAEVTTYSFGAQLDVEHEIGTVFDTPVEFYGGVSFERQFHDKDGHSTLILSGQQNFTERQELGGDEETNKFSANAGVTFKLTEKLNLDIGAKYESYSTPRVDIQPQQAAEITLDDSDSLAVFARMVVGLGPEAHPSPILSGAVQSDRRLKRDIVHVATLENGIKLYAFRYLWSDQVYIGVMAQDLLADKIFRDAVVLKPNGFYAVDYASLGLTMATLDAWREYGLAAVMARPASASASLPQPLR